MRLYCEIRGVGFPILCLHGHPGSAQAMAVFTESLSDRYQTLTPDLRGYGRSRTPLDFELQDSLNDLVELLDTQNIERCLVLGWSLGGILAIELALRHPDRIAGLILVATAARPVGSHPPVTWPDLINTGLASLINLAIPGHPWVIQTLGKRSLYRYLLQQHSSGAYHRLAKEGFWAYLGTSKQANRALNRALAQRYNRLPNLGAIAAPSLVLCGAQDRHITAQASLETAAHLPQADSRCYPDTAHLLPWEIPDQLLQDIHQWLEQQTDALGLKDSWAG
ncbi:alpha/beta fold hydrolase [Leptolyngbya sp. KIOST-1]|uniref:alpha/beta fold hydrolase n=1 Tax=Leptolyngbya sp. KIOST-1 TaxID=1229172 RepID=UPI000907CF48|nr:alpha/beta hydrolase [Leptolyngbya sp. KIOST-1]